MLHRLPGIMELVSTPFLLYMVTQCLVVLLSLGRQQPTRPISRAVLYAAFTTAWAQQAQLRLLSGDGTNGVSLTREWVTEALQFGQWVALKQYLAQASKFDLLPVCPCNHPNQIQKGIPLKSSTSSLRFLHKSIGEYFLSLALLDNLLKPTCSQIWGAAALCHEQGVINFLAEGALSADIRQCLLSLVLSSRITETSLIAPQSAIINLSDIRDTTAHAAALAITVLNVMRHPFSGMDLQGIRVPLANLDFSVMHRTDLSNADLRGCRFHHAYLKDTCLDRSLLQGLQMGQQLLTGKGQEAGFALHPCGQRLFWWARNGLVTEVLLPGLEVVRTFPRLVRHMTCMGMTADGSLLVLAGPGLLVVQSTQTGEEVTRWRTRPYLKDIDSVIATRLGESLIVAAADMSHGVLTVWSPNQLLLREREYDTENVTVISLGSSPFFVVGLLCSMQLRRWDNGQVIWMWGDGAESVAMSPSGNLMAVSNQNGVYLFELGSEGIELVQELEEFCYFLTFYANGTRLLLCQKETLTMWDIRGNRALYQQPSGGVWGQSVVNQVAMMLDERHALCQVCRGTYVDQLGGTNNPNVLSIIDLEEPPFRPFDSIPYEPYQEPAVHIFCEKGDKRQVLLYVDASFARFSTQDTSNGETNFFPHDIRPELLVSTQGSLIALKKQENVRKC
eukprot:Lithocolla_globosa_v1_NODE_192_length_5318_cov_28.700741.p1 type:complete len:674 gc:universal NODE_192_length_5318_cov_28.700741:3600-1579(-)